MIANYCVNDRPFYMYMAINSFKMLRQHNQDIPIKLFFIEGFSTDTAECGCYVSKEDFFEECANLSVEVVVKEWRDTPGEESYFPINKTYLAQLEDDRVLFIDVDTFIFGDVATLFDKYSDVDVAACKNRWVKRGGWSNSLLTSTRDVAPFNSGIMLFNNGFHKGRFEQWGETVRDIREGDSALTEWLTSNGRIWNREEMALSVMIANSDASYAYFDRKDAYNILWPKDIEELDKSLIAHTYTENWKTAYNIVRGNTTKKKFRPKLIRR